MPTAMSDRAIPFGETGWIVSPALPIWQQWLGVPIARGFTDTCLHSVQTLHMLYFLSAHFRKDRSE